MRRPAIVVGAAAIALFALILALVVSDGGPPTEAGPAAAALPTGPATAKPGFLYGRITISDGAVYEGRLRFGRDQEAFWNDYFNGVKSGNPWAEHEALARRPEERSFEIFGIELAEGATSFDRQFMSRFGDIARIEANFREVQVTLKSGTTVTLNRFEAGDIGDGVRVWDSTRGVLDIGDEQIRTIQFLPTPPLAGVADRLYGTVLTTQGAFTGFVLWDQQDRVSTDELTGRMNGKETNVPYDTIRSIRRQSPNSALVTVRDGQREMLLSDMRDVSHDNRGIYVDDARYGRVQISWNVFERADFSAGGSGPGYDDFPAGRALAGTVTARDGRRLSGRLVFDFDESETTDTLDVYRDGVDFNIPFAAIASIVRRAPSGRAPGPPTVMLRSGEELKLLPTGDLAERNAGLLVFATGRNPPEYVPWADVERIDFDD